MKQNYTVTGMTCSACSAHVDKAVRKVPGVEEVNVNLLGGSMQVTGDVDPQAVIKAVTDAGYGASLPGSGGKKAEKKSPVADTEEELKSMKRRFCLSLVFLLPLFYLSMGHMMGWPVPACFHGTENAMNFSLSVWSCRRSGIYSFPYRLKNTTTAATKSTAVRQTSQVVSEPRRRQRLSPAASPIRPTSKPKPESQSRFRPEAISENRIIR